MFKFFDIHNKGSVNMDQFGRSLQKIGVVLSEDTPLEKIFQHYDVSADGAIDYKEFSSIVLGEKAVNPAELSARYNKPKYPSPAKENR
jgi:Ca2+-binding EF-hand superfamily protein